MRASGDSPTATMSEVKIGYTEEARGLFWTEYIEESELGQALLDATSRGETERAAAISHMQAMLDLKKASSRARHEGGQNGVNGGLRL